jgi:hypothetical protein
VTSLTPAATHIALRQRRVRTASLGAFAVVVSLFVGGLVQTGRLQLTIMLVVALAIAAMALRSPRTALVLEVVWLIGLGLIRRLVDEAAPISHSDPMLLVSPLVLGLLTVAASQTRAFSRRSALANAVLVLQLLILVGAANPLQGSLAAGIAGLLFVFVPTLAFWIGRGTRDTADLRLVLTVLAMLGLATAGYGLLQTFGGFPSWDERWIHSARLQSLNVNGTIRAFSAFSSSAEYGSFLSISILVWVLMGVRRLRMLPPALGALAVLIPALVYESSRGAVVTLVLALGVVVGAWWRLPLPAAAVVAAGLLVLLVFAVRTYGPSESAYGGQAGLISHQVQGLANPFDPQTSTLGTHLSLVVDGLKKGFSNPLGLGVGAVTIAGSKFGGLVQGTETDPSNVAVALGLPGLASYLTVFGVGFSRVYRFARRRRDLVALAALAIVTATLFQWLNGGLYAVAILPWLALGWVDRRELDERGEAEA